MPPQNRARKFGGGGGGIDLGALLMSVYGGVEANPDAMMQGPTPSGQALGGGDPYKARTIFDRNEAAGLNAQYRAQQNAADLQKARELQLLRDSLPINLQDYINQQTAQTGGELGRYEGKYKQDLIYKPQLNKIEEEHQRVRGNDEFLNTQGFPALPGNLEDFQSRITPRRMDRTVAQEEAQTTAANTANIQSGIQGEVALKTKPDVMNLAPAELQYKLQQIQSGQRMLPHRENAEIDQYARDTALGNLRLRLDGLQNVQGGLYDPLQGGFMVKPPVDPVQAMAAEKMGIQPPSFPTANPRMPNAERRDYDGIQIDAVRAPAGPPMPPPQATPQALTNNVSAPQQPAIQPQQTIPASQYTPSLSGLPSQDQVAKVLQGILARMYPQGALH